VSGDDLSLDHDTVAAQLAERSPWLAPFVVIDVESTGLDSDPDARVVELAAILFVSGKPTGRRVATRINPGMPIPAEATAIHGISDADVIGAPTFAEAWAFVVELYDTDDTATIAYSAAFDREFARREVARARIARPPLGLRRPWIDPLVWVRHFDRYVKGSGRHKLAATCARRKVELVKAHAAEDDAIAAGLLWMQLEPEVRSCIGTRPHGVREVLRLQSVLATEQDARHAAWVAECKARDAQAAAFEP
jgi:DNA polymerase-3 subunit epsilon